jgi:hypothetical protein
MCNLHVRCKCDVKIIIFYYLADFGKAGILFNKMVSRHNMPIEQERKE